MQSPILATAILGLTLASPAPASSGASMHTGATQNQVSAQHMSFEVLGYKVCGPAVNQPDCDYTLGSTQRDSAQTKPSGVLARVAQTISRTIAKVAPSGAATGDEASSATARSDPQAS